MENATTEQRSGRTTGFRGRILLLNQYAPPDPAPTAKLVGELAQCLRRDGYEVRLIGTKAAYRTKQKSFLARLWRELSALVQILIDGLFAPPVDVIFSTSSPPGLFVVATVLSLLKRAKSVHWALDLYPELAFALGKPVPGVCRTFCYAIIRFCYRAAAIVVTLDEDMQAHIQRLYGKKSRLIRPWVLHRDLPVSAPFPPKETFIWLYSGNLGRAHEWKTILEAQQILEAKGLPIQLVIQGGGHGWLQAQRFAEEHQLLGVKWLPYVADGKLLEVLLASHVLIVTQKPITQGLLWPSKLGLVNKLPRPLVFVGPKQGAISEFLSENDLAAVFEPGDSAELASHLENQFRTWPPGRTPDVDTRDELPEAYEKWSRVFDSLVKRPELSRADKLSC